MFMFSMAFLTFVLTTTHLLSTLACLEFMALSMFFLITMISLTAADEMFSSMLYISIAVCEGALGLSLVVLLVRKKGSDLIANTI